MNATRPADPAPNGGLVGPGEDLERFDTMSFPLCVQVPGGWWRFFPVEGGAAEREYVAQLVAFPAVPSSVAPTFLTRQPSLWKLEEQLGWAIPLAGHTVLRTAAPWLALGRYGALRPAGTGSALFTHRADTALPDEALAAGCRPARARLVLRAGHPPTTYGRLLYAENAARRWAYGPLRVEILTPEPAAGTTADGDHAPRLAYRVYDQTRVVFVGDDVPLPDAGADSTAAIRAVVTAITADRGGVLTSNQRHFLAADGVGLAHAVRPFAHPYPPSTPVTVTVADPARGGPATGLVLASATGPDGGLVYLWRPDVADLPGHSWRTHPTRALPAPAGVVEATLGTPDVRTHDPAGEPVLLATGALVAAIDDPRFHVATVLRTFAGDGPSPRYEIQPHDTAAGPIEVNAGEVIPLAGTAWPTSRGLLHARDDGGLPLRPFELIVAVRDYGVATDGWPGIHFEAVGDLPPAPATLDPTAHTHAVDVTPGPPPRRPAPHQQEAAATGFDGVRHLWHPELGHLAVPHRLYAQARDADPARLAAVLERRPWLPAGPHSAELAAVLAALHAPAELAALTPRALDAANQVPGPDLPLAGGPPTDAADPPGPGL
ncbi:hypothetical protein I6A84_16420 [Frankia sp. CNm7]|uniref:Uncharacterized protein n=1 Tax=Frankia nepalensis TaxID=1836974 RepID=A0A937RJK9_9ACTN|nr:hypothetical protein [Frankia nepalensis]MBL7498308.1 hypothetical protein [Frankia nepalensis]MBL7512977.1 hypothetical protein [Frankia nepalensis]MBL7519639.1 hypothetical protein [Frankia nepalensis]MBL7630145.1 hypothetical protein [Frankia nepalensis]